ncbi:ABC transporter permease [Chakrabartyella piscis]|uniref:ABC transporter permease n=1 Tax=Chakrabartyella piscis TaxID=2918914 RepID=UPI002958CF7F|nr:ABC transporter permease subunit [Chakrabartyella piscis]
MQKNKSKIRIWAVLFWLIVWQIGDLALDNKIFLVSPFAVLKQLSILVVTSAFWYSIGYSLLRIASGFFLATIGGVVFAILAHRYLRVRELLAPLMSTIKSVPVASFIILSLVWFSSKNLAVLISFLMVLPVVYTYILSGLSTLDFELLEMSRVFQIPKNRQIRYVILPQIMPHFQAAISIGAGLCWKAGVAAEVIGMPKGSMGEHLQQAKAYFDIPNLFAWTVVIVLVSIVFEKVIVGLTQMVSKQIRRM